MCFGLTYCVLFLCLRCLCVCVVWVFVVWVRCVLCSCGVFVVCVSCVCFLLLSLYIGVCMRCWFVCFVLFCGRCYVATRVVLTCLFVCAVLKRGFFLKHKRWCCVVVVGVCVLCVSVCGVCFSPWVVCVVVVVSRLFVGDVVSFYVFCLWCYLCLCSYLLCLFGFVVSAF